MATLIANAATTQNLTGAATFAAAEVGALSIVLNRNSMQSLAAAATVTSNTFTITNLKVIDAVLLFVRVAAASPTGTFKVDLQLAGVSQASVTVNKSDLPQFFTGQATGNMVPVLFKLGSTVTGTGVGTYTIVLTTTGTIAVNYAAATGSTTNLTRALRTTTAATAAATDDLYIIGELTGAGAHNSRTVTMDQTANTAYGNGSVNSTTVAGGGIHCGLYGALTYGTSASTNYVLRVNGDLWVWEQGPLSIGASGTEIPRTSTAVLEFQQASADGDFGLRVMDNATFNAAGLSRTSGKNVVQCKLTADVASNNVITSNGTTNGTATDTTALEASGLSLLASSYADNVSNVTHGVIAQGPSISNTTQTATVWLARGTGTNNRFVRLTLGNNSLQSSVTNGFFSDIDLQSGTAGTVTAVGNGTATSVSIAVLGGGYLIRMTGKVSSGTATPALLINACSAAGVLTFAGAGNQCFIYDHQAIVNVSSLSDTTFNVDADTGWLNGDVICVASTTRTATECEIYPLNANAGASSIVSGLYPFNRTTVSTHHGTSPVQAEIGLLTRNVKIRSTSSTLRTYVYCSALATVNVSWVEFYYIGVAGVATKRGIEIDVGATANAKSFTYCSMHDIASNGIYCNANGATSLNLTLSNNVIWNNYSAVTCIVSGVITNTDWTFDSNLMMRVASGGYLLSDIGGTFTNNTVVGAAASAAFNLNEVSSSSTLLGTFDGNSAHACVIGLTNNVLGLSGTINNLKLWRNGNVGLSGAASCSSDLLFTNLTLFGNTTNNISWTSGDTLNIDGGTVSGDTSFATTNGINLVMTSQDSCRLNIANLDMSGVGGVYAPHTGVDFNYGNTLQNPRGVVNNSKFGAPVLINASRVWANGSFISFAKYSQTTGDHRTEMTYGQLKTDSTLYNTAAPSMRMTPNNASSKLESAPKGRGILSAVANGTTVSVSVNLRKSAAGDGAAYNGNQPRLIQRANAALGQNSDVVLGTVTVAVGNWEQLTASSSSATDDGAWEFIIDCDGTAGWVNVDDWNAN